MLTETILIKLFVNVNSEASPTPKQLNGYAFVVGKVMDFNQIPTFFKNQLNLSQTEKAEVMVSINRKTIYSEHNSKSTKSDLLSHCQKVLSWQNIFEN